MASLLTILAIFCAALSQIEARESVFFSKMNPVRRYSQLVSTSIPALAPLTSAESTPAPAPAPSSSEIESPSENYVYGFYRQEVGEFPVATTKTVANANAAPKMTRGDRLANNDARFGTFDESQKYEANSNSMYSKFGNYEDDEYNNNNGEVSEYSDFQRGRYGNNNVPNKYTTRYDDGRYGSNYDQYTDENSYYVDEFETRPRTISGRRYVDNGRYYKNSNGNRNGNRNGNGYYDSRNGYNSMEVYKGVYQYQP